MKRITFSLCFFLATLNLFAQQYLIKDKAVLVHKDITYELKNINGSRTTLAINLPPNTKTWWYTFETHKGEIDRQSINLFAQLTRFIDESGSLATLTNDVLSKNLRGSHRCHVYVLDPPNEKKFLKKHDWNILKESFTPLVKHKNVVKGAFYYNGGGKYYLGFQNPNNLNSINVTVSVTAIVEEKIYPDKKLQDAIRYGDLGWNYYKDDNLKKAIKYSLKALELDKSQPMGYVKANLGLFYLIKNKEKTSMKYYLEAISDFRKDLSKDYYFTEAIKDLDEAKQKHPSLKGYKPIRDLLQMEYKR